MQIRKIIIAFLCLISVSCLFSVSTAFAQDTGEVNRNSNLRAGPGVNHKKIGYAPSGTKVIISGQNSDGSWYQLGDGKWIAAFLVDRSVAPVSPPSLGTPATVTRIIDGDTIDVSISDQTYRVRYILIDTPERGDHLFTEATDANRRLVEGKTVYLQKDVSETDRYKRLLRYIYLADGTFVNAEIVRQGFATLSTYPPDVSKANEIREAQQEAVSAKRGLWTSSKPVQPVTTANRNANLRQGPGTNYAIVGRAPSGQALSVIAQNSTGSWYQLQSEKWIAAYLVDNAPTKMPVSTSVPLPTATPPAVTTKVKPTFTNLVAPTSVCSCSGNIYNCNNFGTHAEAQNCFNYCQSQTGRDVHRLDRDNDNLACESLP